LPPSRWPVQNPTLIEKQFSDCVGEIAAILQQLIADAKAGLLTSIGDTARAETFVEFLDHGRAYLREKRKMESVVIVGVVFEDTVRRICEKNGITQSGKKLDDLISELQKTGRLTPVQGKRARVGADVRTKATHAQWDQLRHMRTLRLSGASG
jgi:hypothetical protein